MNKILHVLVYVFLVLAGAALFFELQLNAKRSELTDRNRMQEDYIVRIARTVEKTEPDKTTTFEIKKDNSPVEARLVDSPDMENILEEYPAPLEQANLETFNWDGQSERTQLRTVYVLDADGKPVMDGNEPLKRGKGTEDELLSKLFESAKAQQSRLNTTRAALADLRSKLESVVAELNKLKPEARQDKVTILEQREKMEKLEGDKSDLENQVTKVKSQIDELNGEISSLKDEVTTAKDETEAAKEETAKAKQLIESLRKMLKESIQTQGSKSADIGVAVDIFHFVRVQTLGIVLFGIGVMRVTAVIGVTVNIFYFVRRRERGFFCVLHQSVMFRGLLNRRFLRLSRLQMFSRHHPKHQRQKRPDVLRRIRIYPDSITQHGGGVCHNNTVLADITVKNSFVVHQLQRRRHRQQPFFCCFKADSFLRAQHFAKRRRTDIFIDGKSAHSLLLYGIDQRQRRRSQA